MVSKPFTIFVTVPERDFLGIDESGIKNARRMAGAL